MMAWASSEPSTAVEEVLPQRGPCFYKPRAVISGGGAGSHEACPVTSTECT